MPAAAARRAGKSKLDNVDCIRHDYHWYASCIQSGPAGAGLSSWERTVMAHIEDLGKRIELVSMDPHCDDISIGLYEQGEGDGFSFLPHTYSQLDGAAARIGFLVEAMATLGGLERVANGGLRFPCGVEHAMGCRRIFLESCKIPTGSALDAKPLAIFDKKSERTITVTSDGKGGYHLTADGPEDGRDRRVGAIAKGLAKLAEMDSDADDHVRFACGHAHDAMIGLLLGRALNVRAAIREQEDKATRGVLAAPSAQSD
jgi:hypothetical protein